jgi:hypothetical protein
LGLLAEFAFDVFCQSAQFLLQTGSEAKQVIVFLLERANHFVVLQNSAGLVAKHQSFKRLTEAIVTKFLLGRLRHIGIADGLQVPTKLLHRKGFGPLSNKGFKTRHVRLDFSGHALLHFVD